MKRNYIPYFSKNCSIHYTNCTTIPLNQLDLDNGDFITNPYDIAIIFNNYFASKAETTKKPQNIHIFQTFFQLKVIVQYFCNLLIKKK